MITKEKKKILEPKRRCHMWESTFYFNVVVSKEICGSYGCPRPAMGRNMNCRYILFFSLTAMSSVNYCELTQLEKPGSWGTLTGVQLCEVAFTSVASSETTYRRDGRRGSECTWRRWVDGPASLHRILAEPAAAVGCGGPRAVRGSLLRFRHFKGWAFFFFFWSNTIHRFMLGKAKSSALKNLKDRAFCIHSFLVHCEKERSGTRQNAMGLKGVSIVLAVLNGKTEVNDVSVINVTQSCWRAICPIWPLR